MIIKTRGGAESWRFYDNARAVHYASCHQSDVPKVDVMSDEENCGVSFDADGVLYENMLDPETMDSGCIRISFLDDQNPRELYVNRETYLLNDNGRTIERLF
jgi:hypothetical protein